MCAGVRRAPLRGLKGAANPGKMGTFAFVTSSSPEGEGRRARALRPRSAGGGHRAIFALGSGAQLGGSL